MLLPTELHVHVQYKLYINEAKFQSNHWFYKNLITTTTTQTTRLLVQTQDEMLGKATIYTQLTVVLPFWKYIHYNIPTRAITDL